MAKKNHRTKTRHLIDTKLLSSFVHESKKKKKKGNRKQIARREIDGS